MSNDRKVELENLIYDIRETLSNIEDDIRSTATNKSAARRVRKELLNLEKLGKTYRKMSVAFHKK